MTCREVLITIETADHLLEDVPAEIDCDEETYELEPYSWGSRRGFESTCNSARIKAVRLGGMAINRFQLVAWIGEREVERQEALACEAVNELLREAA